MCAATSTLPTGNMDTTCKPNTPHDTQSNSSSPGPKHVTFDLPESSSDQTKEDLTNETPDLGSTGKSHNKSETISVTSNNVTLDSQPSRLGRYKKGLNASFLRHNPRHINEPVCHVLPNETSSSVQDCLQWEPAQGVQSNPQRKKYVLLYFIRTVTHSCTCTCTCVFTCCYFYVQHLHNCSLLLSNPSLKDPYLVGQVVSRGDQKVARVSRPATDYKVRPWEVAFDHATFPRSYNYYM